MKTITVADALTSSIPERIQLVEDIWDSIAAESDAIELTDEEKAKRLEDYHKNPDLGYTWEEVYTRLVNMKGIYNG